MNSSGLFSHPGLSECKKMFVPIVVTVTCLDYVRECFKSVDNSNSYIKRYINSQSRLKASKRKKTAKWTIQTNFVRTQVTLCILRSVYLCNTFPPFKYMSFSAKFSSITTKHISPKQLIKCSKGTFSTTRECHLLWNLMFTSVTRLGDILDFGQLWSHWCLHSSCGLILNFKSQ